MNAKLSGAKYSKTVWFNTVIGSLLLGLPEMKDTLPILKEYVTPEVYRWLLLGVVIGNIWLRAITTAALEDKAKE